MKKNLLSFLASVALLTGSVSCKSSKVPVLDTLSSGTWELVKVNGNTINVTDYGKGFPTATFNKDDKTISGSGGCNRYNGTYTLSDDGSFKVGPVMSTKMACVNGGNGETVYYQALDAVNKIRVSKAKVVMLKDNKELLEYKLLMAQE